jgi:hypothetical protein
MEYVTATPGEAFFAVPVVMMGYAVPCMMQASPSPLQSYNNDPGQTTICFRNLPNNYSVKDVRELLDSHGFHSYYDFLYVPHDFKRLPSLVNIGYFFVNFTTEETAQCAWSTFDNFEGWSVNSNKILKATWANETQGLKSCIARYRNSPVMHKNIPTVCKPLILLHGRLVPLRPSKKLAREPRLSKLGDGGSGGFGNTVGGKPLEGETCVCEESYDSGKCSTSCGDSQQEEGDLAEPVACGSDGELAKGSDGGGDEEEDEASQSVLASTCSSSTWVLDADAPACYGCAAAFSRIRRRHHCRACGQVCCAVCAPLTDSHGWFGLLRRQPDTPVPTFKRLCLCCVGKVEWSSDASPGVQTVDPAFVTKKTFIEERATVECERPVVTFPY